MILPLLVPLLVVGVFPEFYHYEGVCIREWYDRSLGSVYLVVVVSVIFVGLWSPWVCWCIIFKEERGVRAKLAAFGRLVIRRLVWAAIGGLVFNRDWWESFLGGHEVCAGYSGYIM